MEQEEVINKGEEAIKKRKDRFTNWIKEPLNFFLVAVLVFAVAIRLYYFFLVGNQPLWWDEAVYGSLAKNLITHQWNGTDLITGETHIRPIIFSIMWASLLLLKIPESGVRFILVLIPSILSVFFVYLIGKEVFNKRVGIISSFIFSVMWIHLFYSLRLLTHITADVFAFASVYFFIKSVKSELNLKLFSISLFLISISTLIRYPNGLFLSAYLIILILNKKLYLNKVKFWYAGIIGLLPLLIFFAVNLVLFGNIFPALLGGDYLGVSDGEKVNYPINFGLLNFIPILLQKTFFIFFIFGVLIILFELVLGYNFILKNKTFLNYILLLLIFAVTFSFYIFYLRYVDDRYLTPLFFIMASFSSFGIDKIQEFIKKYNKIIPVIFVLAVLLVGAYYQVIYADNLIKQKASSFLQIRQGFEWIRDNTPKDSLIMGDGPYVIYYSERNYFFMNSTTDPRLENADYFVAHIFGSQPDYVMQYMVGNQKKWNPIKAYFLDEQNTQPVVIIYQNNR